MKFVRLKLLLIILLISICTVLTAQTDTVLYLIVRTIPENIQIRVGDRMCKVCDTITNKDTIFIEHQQIMTVFAIYPPSAVKSSKYKISKNFVIEKTSSPYSDIRGLYSKGENDIDIIANGDSIILDHDIDTSYQYRIRINRGEKVYLPSASGKLVLQWDLFKDYSGLIDVYVDRKRKNSRFDIETIKTFKIDIININANN